MKRIILAILLACSFVLLATTSTNASTKKSLAPVTFTFVNTQESTGTIEVAWTMASSVTEVAVDVDGTTIDYGAIASYGRQNFTNGAHTFTITPSSATRTGKSATITVALS